MAHLDPGFTLWTGDFLLPHLNWQVLQGQQAGCRNGYPDIKECTFFFLGDLGNLWTISLDHLCFGLDPFY